MGLTVHFKLVAPRDTDAERACELVRAMRRRAQGFKQRGRVDDVLPIGDDDAALRWATQYKSVPHPWKPGCASGIEIRAEAGFLFPVAVGEDCEPLWLGLCRYPKTVLLEGRRYRTDLSGWRCQLFQDTVREPARLGTLSPLPHGSGGFAGRDAPSRFGHRDQRRRRFWPGRSFTTLRRNLDEMNGIVAAAAGALKDSDEAANGQSRVQSPIFVHKDFERLEAEGAARVRPALKKLRAVIREA